MTGTPVISWPRRRAAAAPRTRGRAARPGSGSARRSASVQPADAASRADASAMGPQALEGRAEPGQHARDAPDPRPVRLAERPRHARPDAGLALAGIVQEPGQQGVRLGHARPPAATRRHRGHAADRPRASNRRAPSCGGVVQVASAARSSGDTRARRCVRNWRTLDAHQEAIDPIDDGDEDPPADRVAWREEEERDDDEEAVLLEDRPDAVLGLADRAPRTGPWTRRAAGSG